MGSVRCHKCYSDITSKDDLYTYLSLDGIHALCTRCYTRNQKGFNPIREPINGQSTIVVMILVFVVCAFFAVRHLSWIWVIIALLVPLLRLSSWFLIERKIRD